VTNQINAGTYVFNRDIVQAIPTEHPVSVERETFPGLLAAGAKVMAHVDSTYWRDLGKPSDFVSGSADLVRGIAPSDAIPGPIGDALIDPAASVEPGATVIGGSAVGAGCQVAADAVVDGSVLLDGVRVLPGAIVRNSIVGANAEVGAGTVLDEAVIGDHARLGARLELRHGIRIWPGVELPDGSVRFSADS
jgi:mannose-1-phosphate guanylyltransferase